MVRSVNLLALPIPNLPRCILVSGLPAPPDLHSAPQSLLFVNVVAVLVPIPIPVPIPVPVPFLVNTVAIANLGAVVAVVNCDPLSLTSLSSLLSSSWRNRLILSSAPTRVFVLHV